MKIVFSTKNVSRASFLDTCRYAFDYGFEGFEIYDAIQERYGHHDSILRRERIADAKRKLINRNLTVSALRMPAPVESEETTAELIEKYVSLAATSGIENVIVRAEEKVSFDILDEKMAAAIKLAESSDVNILFETVGNLARTENVIGIINHFASAAIGVSWNVRGTYFDAGETAETTIKNLGAYIKYVRLGDMKDGKTVEDAIAYAHSKGIKPMIWYNSSIGWINGAPGPKFRLNDHEDREKEFAWCEKLGVAGVKVDFFSGDNQVNMDYCIELMECAARHNMLINFHGAPIPRGWQRTYPNLLTTEGVYGAEWYNNVPTFTKIAASHNAVLPFTRNVIGPMDYTPCAFSDSQHPHITSNAHELALTVLFESGLQHLADSPESFLAQPQEVQDFLGQLPAVWDDTRYVSGYPGVSAVLARRSGKVWYVAGINGTDEPMTLDTDLSFIGRKKVKARMFADTADQPWQITDIKKLPTQVECQPRGGFLLVIGK